VNTQTQAKLDVNRQPSPCEMTTSDSAQLNGDVTSHMRNAASSAADHDVTVTSTAAAMKANGAL